MFSVFEENVKLPVIDLMFVDGSAESWPLNVPLILSAVALVTMTEPDVPMNEAVTTSTT